MHAPRAETGVGTIHLIAATEEFTSNISRERATSSLPCNLLRSGSGKDDGRLPQRGLRKP